MSLRYWRPWDWWFHRRDRRGAIATNVFSAGRQVRVRTVSLELGGFRPAELFVSLADLVALLEAVAEHLGESPPLAATGQAFVEELAAVLAELEYAPPFVGDLTD